MAYRISSGAVSTSVTTQYRFGRVVVTTLAFLSMLSPILASPRALSAEAQTSNAARFGPMTITGIEGFGFEPDLRTSKGNVYISSPGTLSSGVSWLWRSLDAGKTFKWVPAAVPMSGKLPTCVGGGDTELAIDSADHLYFNDLILANFATARSDDKGLSFTPPNCTSVASAPDDRQWYAVDGDPTSGGNLFLAYNVVASSPSVCGGVPDARNVLSLARSPAPAAPGSDAGVHFAPTQSIGAVCDEGIMGNNEVSPTTHHIFIVHDSAAFNAIRMARCQTVDFTVTPSGLSCVDLPVASFPGEAAGSSFPTMAIDAAGTLYAAWEQTPVDTAGNATGETSIHWSSSTDEGNTWTSPVTVPTPGLNNNIFVWLAAGDAGKVDLAWYGTPAKQSPHLDPLGLFQCSGPGTANGDWSLWFSQTMNGSSGTPTFASPVQVGGHFIHRGGGFSLIGRDPNDLCNARGALGDFFQLRTGQDGEAMIAFIDSNNRTGFSHNMFVKQIGGPSVKSSAPVVNGQTPPVNGVSDPAGDATFDANSAVSASRPVLDILASNVAPLGTDGYRITMDVADLRSLSSSDSSGDTNGDVMWLTQWLVPSTTGATGGKNFFVAMESKAGATPKFLSGESSVELNGGGVSFTYPGAMAVTGSYTPTAPGTITIDVKKSQVPIKDPIDNKLYSVTASTMTLVSGSNTAGTAAIGGLPFNLIDVAPAYEFDPATAASGNKGAGQGKLAATGARQAATAAILLILIGLLLLIGLRRGERA